MRSSGSCPASLSSIRTRSHPDLFAVSRREENFWEVADEMPQDKNASQLHGTLGYRDVARSGCDLSESAAQSNDVQSDDESEEPSSKMPHNEPLDASVADQFAVFLADIDANLGSVSQNVEEAMDANEGPVPDQLSSLFSELARNDSSYDSLAAGSSASNLVQAQRSGKDGGGTTSRPLFAMGDDEEEEEGMTWLMDTNPAIVTTAQSDNSQITPVTTHSSLIPNAGSAGTVKDETSKPQLPCQLSPQPGPICYKDSELMFPPSSELPAMSSQPFPSSSRMLPVSGPSMETQQVNQTNSFNSLIQ